MRSLDLSLRWVDQIRWTVFFLEHVEADRTEQK